MEKGSRVTVTRASGPWSVNPVTGGVGALGHAQQNRRGTASQRRMGFSVTTRPRPCAVNAFGGSLWTIFKDKLEATMRGWMAGAVLAAVMGLASCASGRGGG